MARRTRAAGAAPGVCAIGETGLDFNRNYSPPARATRGIRCAAAHWRRGSACPYSYMTATAAARSAEALARHRGALRDVVVHCFTGTRGRSAALPRTRLSHRHHRLDLRRTTRRRAEAMVVADSRRSPADRNGLALSTAAHDDAATEDPTQRTGESDLDRDGLAQVRGQSVEKFERSRARTRAAYSLSIEPHDRSSGCRPH